LRRRRGVAGPQRPSRTSRPARRPGATWAKCAQRARQQHAVGRPLLCFAADFHRRLFAGRRLLLRLDLCAESLQPFLAAVVPELAVGHTQAVLAQLGTTGKFTTDIAELRNNAATGRGDRRRACARCHLAGGERSTYSFLPGHASFRRPSDMLKAAIKIQSTWQRQYRCGEFLKNTAREGLGDSRLEPLVKGFDCEASRERAVEAPRKH